MTNPYNLEVFFIRKTLQHIVGVPFGCKLFRAEKAVGEIRITQIRLRTCTEHVVAVRALDDEVCGHDLAAYG